MAVRTPLELIHIYWDQVYNALDVELVREVCADPILRHDPDSVTPLSHDEQIARILRNTPMRPYFTHHVLHADDTFVTSVWNMVSRDGKDLKLCGIEVFKAENGRFTDCWNSTYMKGLWGEADDVFDPAALAPPPLIDTLAKIDADWLQRAFAAGGAVAAQRIAMLSDVAPVGHGTSASTVRVKVGYNVGHITAPTSAIVKIGKAPPNGKNAVGAFQREADVYHFFGREPPFRTPRLYWAARDDEGLCNLVLEDLAHAEPGDQIAGCSPAHAAAAVRELARMHRAYLASPELDRAPWVQDQTPHLGAYVAGAGKLRGGIAGPLPAETFATIDAFGALTERWLAARPRRRTLVHSDPRVDNILFERDAAGALRACIIDWQGATAGDPQYDVAYFLSGSVSPADRRAIERDLVAEHVKILAEADPSYGFDEALAAYRFHIVSGLWLTVVAAAFIAANDHNARLLAALLERNVAAIEDWDALDAVKAGS
jgi:hypothetical protein